MFKVFNAQAVFLNTPLLPVLLFFHDFLNCYLVSIPSGKVSLEFENFHHLCMTLCVATLHCVVQDMKRLFEFKAYAKKN